MTSVFHPLLTLENALYERRLKVSTRGLYGFRPGDWSQKEHLYYVTIPYRGILRILDALSLSSSDVVVDLGCGKGRVVCCASLSAVARVIGVEDAKELCEIAQNNVRGMRGKRAPATVIHGKAEDFDYSQGTVFYMFHPFGASTLRSVLTAIHNNIQHGRRFIRIVYVNPRHDSVLEAASWLERYEHWPAAETRSRSVGHAVSFWRCRSAVTASLR
jgi:predicted RNA methylase